MKLLDWIPVWCQRALENRMTPVFMLRKVAEARAELELYQQQLLLSQPDSNHAMLSAAPSNFRLHRAIAKAGKRECSFLDAALASLEKWAKERVVSHLYTALAQYKRAEKMWLCRKHTVLNSLLYTYSPV